MEPKFLPKTAYHNIKLHWLKAHSKRINNGQQRNKSPFSTFLDCSPFIFLVVLDCSPFVLSHTEKLRYERPPLCGWVNTKLSPHTPPSMSFLPCSSLRYKERLAQMHQQAIVQTQQFSKFSCQSLCAFGLNNPILHLNSSCGCRNI